MPFAYSTKELGKKFLEDSYEGKASSFKENESIIRSNLKSVLERMLPGHFGPFTIDDRFKIIKAIRDEGLTFGYLAFMLADDHPLLNGWAEKERRRDLHYIVGKETLGFENHIVTLELGLEGYEDESTKASIEEEMKPYENFQKRLLERATPTPKNLKN